MVICLWGDVRGRGSQKFTAQGDNQLKSGNEVVLCHKFHISNTGRGNGSGVK